MTTASRSDPPRAFYSGQLDQLLWTGAWNPGPIVTVEFCGERNVSTVGEAAVRMAHVAGRFTFSHRDLELRRDGIVIPLQRQPALVLSCLLAHAGRIVSREELARFVWGDGHHVEVDQSLRYCVRQIRLALDDNAEAPRFIETLTRKGYRWIGAGRLAEPAVVASRRRLPEWLRTAVVAVGAMTLGIAIGQPAIGRGLHLMAHLAAPTSLEIAAEAAIDTIHGFLTR